MRKYSIFIFGTSVIFTALIIGGAFYLDVMSHFIPQTPEKHSDWQALNPQQTQSAGNMNSRSDISAETFGPRTNTPIKCHDPEIGEFWTNAATCEGADLHNRLSHAAPLVTGPKTKPYSEQDYVPPEKQAVSSRAKRNHKPNLRFAGKPPPSGLNISCKFAVGRALEIERDLAASDDPEESKWRENYCKWRCEVNKDRCPADDDYFYYRYRELCRTGIYQCETASINHGITGIPPDLFVVHHQVNVCQRQFAQDIAAVPHLDLVDRTVPG